MLLGVIYYIVVVMSKDGLELQRIEAWGGAN